MCLAVPGKIVDVRDLNGVPTATVDFDGIRKDVCLSFLPDIGIGDYAIVHVGFAIAKVDEAAALESLALFRQIGLLEEELDAQTQPRPDEAVDQWSES